MLLLLRLNSSVASKWASKHFWGYHLFCWRWFTLLEAPSRDTYLAGVPFILLAMVYFTRGPQQRHVSRPVSLASRSQVTIILVTLYNSHSVFFNKIPLTLTLYLPSYFYGTFGQNFYFNLWKDHQKNPISAATISQ